MIRARDTANIINKILKVPIDEYNDIRESGGGQMLVNKKYKDLINMPNGKLLKKIYDKGSNYDLIESTKSDPEYKNLFDKWLDLTGSESYESVAKRVKKVYKSIIDKHTIEDILLVSHGGFNGVFISELFNIEMAGIGKNTGKYSNCTITSIKVEKNKKRLELMLYNKYLDTI